MAVSGNDTTLSCFAKQQARNNAELAYAVFMGFGANLRKARQAKKLTGEQLGGLLGLTKVAISNWENERYEPSLEQIRGLCAALDVSADWLLDRQQSEFSAEARQEARLFDQLSPEDRRKWRAMRLAMFGHVA